MKYNGKGSIGISMTIENKVKQKRSRRNIYVNGTKTKVKMSNEEYRNLLKLMNEKEGK